MTLTFLKTTSHVFCKSLSAESVWCYPTTDFRLCFWQNMREVFLCPLSVPWQKGGNVSLPHYCDVHCHHLEEVVLGFSSKVIFFLIKKYLMRNTLNFVNFLVSIKLLALGFSSHSNSLPKTTKILCEILLSWLLDGDFLFLSILLYYFAFSL